MGRPSKGKRDAIMAKPPIAFGEILRRNAEAQGMTNGEYLVALAAEALDMPQFSPAPQKENQLELAGEAHPRAA